MPYGIPKEHGGDSPENEKKMVDCTTAVKKKGYDNVAAIRICKASMFGPKGKGTRG